MFDSSLVGNRWNTILQKLLANVVMVVHVPALGPCWDWTGPTGGGRDKGRPRMKLDNHTVQPHRVSYVHFNGYLPPSKQVDHVCENYMCINPMHLEAVTHKENQKRKKRREQVSVKMVLPEAPLWVGHEPNYAPLVTLRPLAKCEALVTEP